MDNIQLCYIDNEINKIDKMKQGDVIYKNGMELLVVLSYDHNEPCKGCFFYKNKACGSEKLIKCWDCKKEYIFTAIRKYNTTELCGIVKRYEETYKIILKTIKKIEKECQKYVIWDTVHVMLKDDGELIIKALSKDKSVLLNDFIIYVNNNGSQDEENYKETILEQEYIINTICDDLEREGYSVQPIIVPACGVGAPHKRYRIWFIASDCSDARVEGLRQGREDKIHGFEFTSQTRDKIRRLITDTSGLRSHRFLYDKEDDKKQRSTENRLFKKYACRDWDGRGSTQWKSFPTQSPICRGNDGLPFNVDNLTIPYGKWRKESIKAYGNAIVPLIAVKIFEMINKIEGYEQQTTL